MCSEQVCPGYSVFIVCNSDVPQLLGESTRKLNIYQNASGKRKGQNTINKYKFILNYLFMIKKCSLEIYGVSINHNSYFYSRCMLADDTSFVGSVLAQVDKIFRLTKGFFRRGDFKNSDVWYINEPCRAVGLCTAYLW